MNRFLGLHFSLIVLFSVFGFGCDSQFSGSSDATRFSSNNDTARVSGKADSADGDDFINDADADGDAGGGGAGGSGGGSDGGRDSGSDSDGGELGMGGNDDDGSAGVGLDEIDEEFDTQCDYFDREYKNKMSDVRIDGGPPLGIDLSKYTLGRSGKFDGDDYMFSFKVYIVKGQYYTNLDDTPRNSEFQTKRYEAVVVDARSPNCEVTARSEGDTEDVRKGCFLSTTMITMADKSQKMVSQIKSGDRVFNPILNKSFVVTEVVRGNEEKAGMIEVGVENHKVSVTSTHPFLTRYGVKQAQELSKFDEVVTASGTFARIQHLKHLPLDTTVQVANLTIGGDQGDAHQHMVLADGVVSGDLFLQKATEQLRQQAQRQMFVLQY